MRSIITSTIFAVATMVSVPSVDAKPPSSKGSMGQSNKVQHHDKSFEKFSKKQPGFESIYDQQWSNLHECQSHNMDQQQCWAYIVKQQCEIEFFSPAVFLKKF